MKDVPDLSSLSPLIEGTIALHELLVSLMRGGFTEEQALKMLAYLIAAGQEPPR